MAKIEQDQKFAKLTAKYIVPEKSRKEETWFCECECGESTTATKSQLLSGRKKSCGCLRKKTPYNALDLRDQVIGDLKVIERAGTNEKGLALWLCKCKCGNKKSFTATTLRRREAISCGCALDSQIAIAREVLQKEKSVDGVAIPLLTKKVRSDSQTGHKGIYKRTRKGREYYEANITIKGKRHFATATTLEDAIAKRKQLEETYHKPYIDQLEERNDD